MTTQSIDNQNLGISPDLIAQTIPQHTQTEGPSAGEKAADQLVNLIRAGVNNGSSMQSLDANNQRLHGYAEMVHEQLDKLSPADQKDFLEHLVKQESSGELDDKLSTTSFELGPTLGALNSKYPETAQQVNGHIKDLFESGDIDTNDVKALFSGEDLRYTGRDFQDGTDPAEGLRQMAKTVDNRDFSSAAVDGLLAETPENIRSAENIYEAALGVGRDAANAGHPDAAFNLVDKMFKDPALRDDMFEKMGEGSGPDAGHSGLLSLVNDLDAQNNTLGNMDNHFGGIGASADRLENVWQGAHEHIGGDEDAIGESNEYFANNISRLNHESRHTGGSNVTENDDRGLISDYVQNVLLDESVDKKKVGHDNALQAIVDERSKLMDSVHNGATPQERLTAAGDLGNLVGSVGAGMDAKFKQRLDDAEEAAGWAATVGGAIVDTIPIVGDLADKKAGELAETTAREMIKKTIEDSLTEGTKPGESPLFEHMEQSMRRQLPDPSNRTQDPAENAFNAELHREYDHSVVKQDVRGLKETTYD